MRSWVFPAMFTFIFWGLWGFIPKITTRYINPTSAIAYEALIGLPMAMIIMAVMRFQVQTEPRGIILASITGVLGLLGALGYLVAVTRGPVSLITAFVALAPALTILLAMVFLGETLAIRQWVGVGMALVAVLLIAV
ncbi:MAG: EamA family transporter [Anaerolineales bacterium]